MAFVDPRYTSQLCSGCGEYVPKTLDVRVHMCPYCGLVLDRDVNAARNILRKGMAWCVPILSLLERWPPPSSVMLGESPR